MPCPICGDICRCSSDANSAAPPRWLADAQARPAPATPGPELETPKAENLTLLPSEAPADGESALNESVAEDSSTWRREVADRVNRYQARRKPRPPRYPSL